MAEEIEPITHLEKVIAGEVEPITHLEQIVKKYAGGGGGGAVWGGITGTLDNQTDLKTALGDKVEKVAGKQLSTEDFTTEEKTKLAGLENTVLEQEPGQSTTKGMSQKAITDIIGDVETILATLTTGTGA